MTVIVGICRDGRAAIAADTMWCQHGATRGYPRDSKIVMNGAWLAGFSGTVAATRPLLKWAKNLSADADLLSIGKSIRDMLDEEGAKPDGKDGAWPAYDVSGILVNRTGVYHMDGTGTFVGPSDYWAIGNGAEYALGVLYDRLDVRGESDNPCKAAIVAVEAAIRFDIYCDGEVDAAVLVPSA